MYVAGRNYRCCVVAHKDEIAYIAYRIDISRYAAYAVVYSVIYVVVYSVLYIVYSAPRGVAHRDELAKHVREPAQPAALPCRCCLLARSCCAAGAGSAAAVVEEYEGTYMQQRSRR